MLFDNFPNLTSLNSKFLRKTRKPSFETNCPSPDRSENPFVPGFGTKDCNG